MDSNYQSVVWWWWWGGISWGKEDEIKRFSREEGDGRMVSMGWRKEKSVLRERVVGKVGERGIKREVNQA